MKIKQHLQLHCGSDGFWYDLTHGGYFKPEDVMADEDEIIEMKKAILIVQQLELIYDEHSEEM
jgi:hypothetical protein